MTILIDDLFWQVSRDVEEGDFGPEAFNILLRWLMTHVDRVDTGEGYTRLHSFSVCTGTPFFDFFREFRVLVSAVTRSERILAPGVDVVLVVVWMAVNEQFPTLMPTLHPGSTATDRSRTPRWIRCRRRSAIWLILRHLSSTATFGSSGVRSSASSGPRTARHGRGQGRVPSQTP